MTRQMSVKAMLPSSSCDRINDMTRNNTTGWLTERHSRIYARTRAQGHAFWDPRVYVGLCMYLIVCILFQQTTIIINNGVDKWINLILKALCLNACIDGKSDNLDIAGLFAFNFEETNCKPIIQLISSRLCSSNASQHAPIYLQPFPSNSTRKFNSLPF